MTNSCGLLNGYAETLDLPPVQVRSLSCKDPYISVP